MLSLLDLFFGCWHRRLSFPITPRAGSRRPRAAITTGTYVCCLDCGREFPYDWKQMKRTNHQLGARSVATRRTA